MAEDRDSEIPPSGVLSQTRTLAAQAERFAKTPPAEREPSLLELFTAHQGMNRPSVETLRARMKEIETYRAAHNSNQEQNMDKKPLPEPADNGEPTVWDGLRSNAGRFFPGSPPPQPQEGEPLSSRVIKAPPAPKAK